MAPKYTDPDPGPDVGEVVSQVSDAAKEAFKKFGPLLIILFLAAAGLKGVYKVDPGARAVVLRFGAEHRRTEPGLHYAIPFIETPWEVDVEEIRRVEVGFRGKQMLPEALMLTGDENIVEVRMVVQYRVSDPSKYLFRLNAPEQTLHGAAEVAIRTVVGRTNIDEVMTKGRSQVQTATRGLLQKLMDEYQSGIEITDLKLDNVDAPDEVKDAFNAVTRAREEKEKLVNQARGYAEDKVPRARGESEKMIREAEGYREQRILQAKGDAAKFESVYSEYVKAKDITRARMHMETLERIYSRVQGKVLIDGEVGDKALPLLSLGQNGTTLPVGGKK